MSKFFRDAASSESESETETDTEAPVRAVPESRRVAFIPSDDEVEDTKRVVRTAKDKRYAELKDSIKQLRNSKKIKDMCKILTIFEDLCVAYQKAKPVIDKEGGFAPRFYLRYLSELESFVNENWEDKESKKNLSKNNAKGLATLRQKLRKYIRETNLEADIEAYKANPDPEGYSSDEESEESEDEAGEGEEFVQVQKKTEKPKAVAKKPSPDDEESGSDDSDWPDESSSEDDDEDIGGKTMEELRKFFLKKDKDDDKTKDKKPDKRIRLQKSGKGEKEDWYEVSGPKKIEMFPKDTEITSEAVLKKLHEILAIRGKKGTDRREMIDMLKELSTLVTSRNLGIPLLVKVLFGTIAAVFDYNPKVADCMTYPSWQSASKHVSELLQILKEHPDIYCSSRVPEDAENVLDPTKPYQMQACILTMFERLDDEFTKILQDADCHSTDYVDKLKGEKDVCQLIDDLQNYLETRKSPCDEICRIYMRRVEHVYYKFDSNDSNRELMESLCEYIYAKDDSRRLRTRSMLCHVYHHALHNRWHEGRDLILISHLQAAIDNADISTQILYNRAICQLGLCAFRHGFIQEAFNALADFQGGGKIKELLAQGVVMQRGQDRSAEQEKLERQRQIPYHRHINLELLECVYLICAMLLEIPQMASKDIDGRRGFRISRSFHYQLKQSERQSLIGPPENTREHVVAASRALLRGDWKSCRDYIINDKMNAKVWNLFNGSESVKAMMVKRIQEEALRTYLFTYSSIYDSISLKNLSGMFDLDKKQVHAIISKMIIQEDLSASLDEPAEIVVIHRVEPTRLQSLAIQMTDKLKSLAENLDQVLEPRAAPGFAYRQQGNWYEKGEQRDRRQQHQQDGGYEKKGNWYDKRQQGDRQQDGGYERKGGRRQQRNYNN